MNANSSSNLIPILLLALYGLLLLGVPALMNQRRKQVTLDTRHVRREQTKRNLKTFMDDLRND